MPGQYCSIWLIGMCKNANVIARYGWYNHNS